MDTRSTSVTGSHVDVLSAGDDATININHHYAAPAADSPISESLANPFAKDRFIGRKHELEQLQTALEKSQTAVVTAEGMAGVGKSYLIDHFALNSAYVYCVLPLNPVNVESLDSLIGLLAGRLEVRPPHIAKIREHLQCRNVLLHIENVDSEEAASVAGQLIEQLQGCRLVLSGRLLDFGRGYSQIRLKAFELSEAISQLHEELRWLQAEPVSAEEAAKIATALQGLPLAIHLAAGYLADNYSVDAFLKALHESQLKLASANPLERGLRNGARQILHAAFAVSFQLLQRKNPEHADALKAFGFMGVKSIGFQLVQEVMAISPEAAETLLRQASKLSLLIAMNPQRDYQKIRWQVHPLLAEYLRAEATAEADSIKQHLNQWFMSRLPEPKFAPIPHYSKFQRFIAWLLRRNLSIAHKTPLSYQAWHELNAEQEALSEWLAYVPIEQGVAVERAGSKYAIRNGSGVTWLQFCQKILKTSLTDSERSNALWTATHCAERCGDLDNAYSFAEEQAKLDQTLGNELNFAASKGQIADILQARGELDEALRIRQDEEMPVYERLGDVRSLLVAQAKIALLLMKFTPPRREEANQLLCVALAAARKMRIPEEQQIERILQHFEMDCLNQDLQD